MTSSPAMPSHRLAFVILPPAQKDTLAGGPRPSATALAFTIAGPIAVITVAPGTSWQTWLGSATMYTCVCARGGTRPQRPPPCSGHAARRRRRAPAPARAPPPRRYPPRRSPAALALPWGPHRCGAGAGRMRERSRRAAGGCAVSVWPPGAARRRAASARARGGQPPRRSARSAATGARRAARGLPRAERGTGERAGGQMRASCFGGHPPSVTSVLGSYDITPRPSVRCRPRNACARGARSAPVRLLCVRAPGAAGAPRTTLPGAAPAACRWRGGRVRAAPAPAAPLEPRLEGPPAGVPPRGWMSDILSRPQLQGAWSKGVPPRACPEARGARALGPGSLQLRARENI